MKFFRILFRIRLLALIFELPSILGCIVAVPMAAFKDKKLIENLLLNDADSSAKEDMEKLWRHYLIKFRFVNHVFWITVLLYFISKIIGNNI